MLCYTHLSSSGMIITVGPFKLVTNASGTTIGYILHILHTSTRIEVCMASSCFLFSKVDGGRMKLSYDCTEGVSHCVANQTLESLLGW